jgi:NAD(P)-dependent dehydrogenase (short-subunit alcohol dehydrogenase family)
MTKIAIVTGASRGFGRGIAQVLATEAGYKVYATARNKSALDELKKAVDANGGPEPVPHGVPKRVSFETPRSLS